MFCWMGVVAMSEKILKAATVKESFKRKAQKTFDIWVEPSDEQEKINELRKDFLNEIQWLVDYAYHQGQSSNLTENHQKLVSKQHTSGYGDYDHNQFRGHATKACLRYCNEIERMVKPSLSPTTYLDLFAVAIFKPLYYLMKFFF